MRISTSLIFNQALRAIQTQQAALAKTQNQLARGTRILTPSDDPAGAKRLLDLRQALELNARFQSNADAATTRLTLEESTLAGVTDVLQRVRELTVQANAATLTDADRRSLAAEVNQRLEELLGLANTRDGNGEYLFAGFSTGTRPFSRTTTGIAYHGDEGQRFLSLGPAFDIAVGDSGTSVFRAVASGNGTFRTLDDPANTGDGVIDAGQVTDPAAHVPGPYTIRFPTADTFEVVDVGAVVVATGPYTSPRSIAFNGSEVTISGAPAAGDRFEVLPATAQDVFTTLSELVATLQAGTANGADRARVHNGLNRALADIDHALDHISVVRSSVGARLNAVESERFMAEDYAVLLQSAISAVEDVDLAEAVTRLTQQSTTLEAAQRSFAMVQGLSLFDLV